MNPTSCPEPRALRLNEDGGIDLILQWKLLVCVETGLNSEILGSEDGDDDDDFCFFLTDAV